MTKTEALQARQAYTSLQPDIIPIDNCDGLGKRPIGSSWNEVIDSKTLWDSLPSNKEDFNIGLRCDRLCAIDCDSVATHEAMGRFFSSLGYHDTPLELTNKGSHYFFRLKDRPTKGESKQLHKDLAGDVRYGKGAQVVIAPSTVNGVVRELQNTTPQKLYDSTPTLVWADLKVLLPQTTANEHIGRHTVVIPIIDRPLDLRKYAKDWVFDGLRLCRELPKGSQVVADKHHIFASRSECQMASFHYLFSLGCSIEEIENLFTGIQPGHNDDFDTLLGKVLTYGHRNALSQLYFRDDLTQSITSKVWKTLIACAWQLNRKENFFITYSAMARYLGLPDDKSNKTKLQRAVKSLETNNFISVKKGYCGSMEGRRSKIFKNGKEIRPSNEYELVCDLTEMASPVDRCLDETLDNL